MHSTLWKHRLFGMLTRICNDGSDVYKLYPLIPSTIERKWVKWNYVPRRSLRTGITVAMHLAFGPLLMEL